jgi:hypothetical protein
MPETNGKDEARIKYQINLRSWAFWHLTFWAMTSNNTCCTYIDKNDFRKLIYSYDACGYKILKCYDKKIQNHQKHFSYFFGCIEYVNGYHNYLLHLSELQKC